MTSEINSKINPVEIFRDRKLIWSLSRNDFKTRFAGVYLGTVWAFIQPIVMVLVYWFVFEKALGAAGPKTRAGIQAPFVCWLMAGLMPWMFFQDAIIGGTNALIEYSYLVKKVVFKISILPVVKVLSSLFVHLFFMALTLIVSWAYGFPPDLYTLQVFYYAFCMIALVSGFAYMTSAVVVFFRDMNQIVGILLQIGVWVTPIMWNLDSMKSSLSPIMLTILKLNPMYYIVNGYRDAFLNKAKFWDYPWQTLYFWVFTIVFLWLGTAVFKKMRAHFADVL